LEELPAVGHFKQLFNKSQEQVPIAVYIIYVLLLGPDYDIPYF